MVGSWSVTVAGGSTFASSSAITSLRAVGFSFGSTDVSSMDPMTSPADLGYPADGYELPPMHLRKHVIAAPEHDFSNGKLMAEHSYSAADMHREMRETLEARAATAAGLCRDEHDNEPVIVWCNTNDEAEGVVSQVPGAREVRGDMRPELKEELLTGFTAGDVRVLVTKPSIAGFGLNWQHCRASVSVGLSYSFEQRYQALRRIWRFLALLQRGCTPMRLFI